MNIGIITLNGSFNYGNRLQNLALQWALEDLGHSVETIWFDRKPNSLLSRTYFNLKAFIKNNISPPMEKIRYERFVEFSSLINETKEKYDVWNVPDNLHHKYEKIVISSDQVWNPNYINDSGVYFGCFAPSEKLLTYAASFGVSRLPVEVKKIYRERLSRLKYISLREELGNSILKEIIGREVPVHIDPTMLVTPDRWRTIMESNLRTDRKYILTYFLGSVSKDYKQQIYDIAREKNYEVMNLMDKKDPDIYTANPSEFLDFIDNAELFCTDSFHGVVFSILFETPFIVFKRDNSRELYSRIETLLERFRLKTREAENSILWKDPFKLELPLVADVLFQERTNSLNYLKLALGDKEKSN